MKRFISIVNCCLSIFLFLCVYGNTCYRFALSGKGGADFRQQVALCFYFAIYIIISIYCICGEPHYSNKCFFVGAIYCALFSVLLFCSWVCSLMFNWQRGSINWLYWICIVISPIISGLFFYAALKKK